MKRGLPSGYRISRAAVANCFLVIISISACLCAVEAALRISGKNPGFLSRYTTSFKPVERLEVLTFFYTDHEGVFKADHEYPWPPDECRINADGFRSRDFNYHKTSRKKIFFAGDSFTWGGEAKPLTESFVDRIERQGFMTFNAGIPGTAHNQYAYLAEKYVPVVKPDIVAIMFFMGNDIIPGDPMQPGKNLFHITNAGWIYGFDKQGSALSPQQAYDYYIQKINIAASTELQLPALQHIKAIAAKSVIGTYLCGGALALKAKSRKLYQQLREDKDHAAERFRQSPQRSKTVAAVRESLQRIQAVTDAMNAEFMLFLIPVHPTLRDMTTSIEDNLYIFEGFDPLVPDYLTKNDYNDPPCGHFNNSGHKKYADFIVNAVNLRLGQKGCAAQ